MPNNSQPKLVVPQLEGFYESVDHLWYPMIRVATGAILFMHGWAKLNSGVTGLSGYFAKIGLEPATGFLRGVVTLVQFPNWSQVRYQVWPSASDISEGRKGSLGSAKVF